MNNPNIFATSARVLHLVAWLGLHAGLGVQLGAHLLRFRVKLPIHVSNSSPASAG